MKWELNTYDTELVNELICECGITELQAKLLINRGIDTIDKANVYLYGDIRDLHDPSSLANIDYAVDILEKAYKNKKKIFIAGDFDVDGCTSCAVTFSAFKNIGLECEYYIPHRINEGYGLSKVAIDVALEHKADIIYTVDNGISAYNEISYALENGLEVIVTDHHDIPAQLPPIKAIVNPKLSCCQYPNKGLCGCSVTWKVLIHLYNRLGIKLDYLYSLLPMVAVATIGDMMKLERENRIIVKEGLKRLNKNYNKGLIKLKNIYKIDEVVAADCSFRLVPALNSSGRISIAYKSTKLLLSEDDKELEELANELYDLNEKRKELTTLYYNQTVDIINKESIDKDEVIIVLNENIEEGLVGLVAGKIKQAYNKPTFIFTKAEQGYKGSGRGVEGHPLSLFEGLQQTKGIWSKGGGHPMAAGLSFDTLENLMLFKEKLNKYTSMLMIDSSFTPFLNIDGIINNPTEETIRELEILEPTGQGNPNALFGTDPLNVETVKPIGDGSHIRFKLTSGFVAVGFSLTQKYVSLDNPQQLKFAYSPNWNVYSFFNELGKEITLKSIQLMISDFNLPYEKTTTNKNLLISSIKSNLNKRKR